MKIVICGSMTTSKKMIEIKERLEKLGHEVVLPKFTEEYAQLETIDHMHTESARNKVEYNLIRGYFNVIKDGDVILVVNEKRHGIENYIGGNSFLEIGFANVLKKPIYLFNRIPNMQYTDEIEAMEPIILNGDLSKIN